MAASAEYELEKRVERLDLFPVELEKGQNAPQSRVPAPPTRSRVHAPASLVSGYFSTCVRNRSVYL